jgi:hypothetical protein
VGRPQLTITQILAWADEFHAAKGQWPKQTSGRISRVIDDTWRAVNCALMNGHRGLQKGSSLAQILDQYRGIRNRMNLPPLSVREILGWADAYHQRTGQWPTRNSGTICEATEEKWSAVAAALHNGVRGLQGGNSLAKLLAKHRGARNRKALSRLTVDHILSWADKHHHRTGKWPTRNSGRIPDTLGENWSAVEASLRVGTRGLPGGLSLAILFEKHRNVRNQKALPPLTLEQILFWAETHYKRAGEWPKKKEKKWPSSGCPCRELERS